MMSGYIILTLCVTAIFCQGALSQLPSIQSDTIDGAVKGKSKVVLQCNAADPSAAVTWMLNGGVITTPNEFGITFNGSSMTIEMFRASSNNNHSHHGDWRCTSGSLVSKKLALSKAKIKNFPANAKDVTVDAVVGTSTLIPCKPPNSNPKADTVFERGETTIDESTGRFSLLSSGDLLISDVQMDDSGRYTCVAINRVLGDKITAPYTVTLNVQQPSSLPMFAPQFQNWSSGEVIGVREGNDLMLPCAVNSNPPEEVTWQVYPSGAPNNRSRQVENSKLIEEIRSSDSATYKCVVEYGSSPSPAVLIYVVNVLTYPRVSFRNREFYAEEGNNMVIKCHIEPGRPAMMSVQWYRDGSLLDSDSDLGIEVMGDELTLTNVSLTLAGMYQCVASNDVGEDTDYMKLYVQKPRPTTTTSTTTPTTTTQAYQPAPHSVMVEQVRREGVKVSWAMNSTVNVLSYMVKAKTGGIDWLTVSRDIPKQATFTEVNSGLVPGSKYKFIVTAIYRHRVHEDSRPSSRIKLDPSFGEEETTPTTSDPPQPNVDSNSFTTTTTRATVMVPPAQPTLAVLSPSELLVTWEPVTTGLPVKFYKIQLKNVRSSYQKWQTVEGTMDSTESTSYKVTKLQPGHPYRVRIGAMYRNDDFEFGPSAKVRMPQSASGAANKPSISPTIISAVQQGNGILLVSWTYSSRTAIDKFIVQYQVADRMRADGWQREVVNVTTVTEMTSNSARLKGLEDNQLYVIQVLAQNRYGTSEPSNTYRRHVVYPFTALETSGDKSTKATNYGSNADETYINPTKTGIGSDNDMLYIILGAVLGSMVLLLIIFVAICGFKQRQQRRAMLSMSTRSQNKFADASKVLYGEQLKQQPNNGMSQQFVTLNGGNGMVHAPHNGTISSMNSQRMSLNINPMNELDEDLSHNTNGELQESREQNTSLDYNLMQHYPHYNSNGSRHTPTYHHNSHQSIDAGSQREGSTHYSHGSLPHYNVHQQYDPVRSTTPQFSTFLPRPNREASPLPNTGKLPHPQGLRPVQYAHSPASSACEGSQSSQQRRRRKKRSQHNRDHMINHSNPGSAKEYNTNTDMSSGEGTGVEEYNHMLPPPPMLPSSYGQSQATDTQDSNTEQT